MVQDPKNINPPPGTQEPTGKRLLPHRTVVAAIAVMAAAAIIFILANMR